MSAYLHCMSHTPLVGYVDPTPEVLAEVNAMIAEARERIDPELIVGGTPEFLMDTRRGLFSYPALHLKVARSRFVRKAIDCNVQGIKTVQAQYQWGGDWETVKAELRRLRIRLRLAVRARDEFATHGHGTSSKLVIRRRFHPEPVVL